MNLSFYEYVKNNTNGEYEVIGEYINYKTDIDIKHNICNNIYKTKPSNFHNGRRCPFCFKSSLKTTKIFKDEVFSKVKDEYIVISEYNGTLKPITMKHNECNMTFETTPNKFLSPNRRCPFCRYKKRYEKTLTSRQDNFFNSLPEEIEFIDKNEYINNTSKIHLKHKKCGRIFTTTANSFATSCQFKCILCTIDSKNRKLAKSSEEFQLEINKKFNDCFELKSEYINNSTPVTIYCKKCKSTFNIIPINLLDSKKTHSCSSKHGRSIKEKDFFNILNSKSNNRLEHNKKINRLELDIFDPIENIGIEFNGMFWHNINHKDKYSHLKKLNFFKDLDISVIFINEDIYENSSDGILYFIKNILKINQMEEISDDFILKNSILSDKIIKFEKVIIDEKVVAILGYDINNVIISMNLFNNFQFIDILEYISPKTKFRLDRKYFNYIESDLYKKGIKYKISEPSIDICCINSKTEKVYNVGYLTFKI